MNKSESKYFNTAIRFDKALLSLIENKPFEYITVSEICEKAKVNRSTFYLHYENTSDLLKETISYVVNDFSSYFSVDKKSITEK
ncbi:MAG: TetR/AcrR family transcriptional regulator, partial [Oscillospiraceae bacterium]|nr:TetR/AcrR family transcriptional regulator [Oscillospiraceae bacterium]